MKQLSLFSTIAVIICLSFCSCKKSDTTNNNTNTSKSYWTFDGVRHSVVHVTSGTTSQPSFFISGDDSVQTAVGITFSAQPASGTYTVIDGNSFSSGLNNTNCIVTTGDFSSFSYTSNGTAGDKVTVTISGGKITASFSNVTLLDFFSSATKKISGVLVQP